MSKLRYVEKLSYFHIKLKIHRKIYGIDFICALISLISIAQKAVKAQILVKILEKMLPSSDKNNFIKFLVKFLFIAFFQNITKILEESLWNEIWSENLLNSIFFNLGDIFPKIFSIIWAFTAFWAIDRKKIGGKNKIDSIN